MYSSLHKIDIVVDDDGAPLCVQTDHRDALQMSAERELSVVFGITRMLAPRFADPSHERLVYLCAGSAPPFLREVVRACGAALAEGGSWEEREPPGSLDLDAVAQMAHDALISLGQAVLQRRGLEATVEAVRALEAEVRGGGELDPEDDEIRYYETLVELAAAAGVVMARLHEGARWRVNSGEHFLAVVPLALEVGGTLSNLFGRSERFLEREVNEGPSALLEMDYPVAGESREGPVVGIIKAAEWIQGYPIGLVSEPLVGGPDLPSIVYAHDHPRSVAYLNSDSSPLSLEDARAQARDFYRQIQVELTEVSDDPPIWFLEGSYYAPEKLLDREYMEGLHARFETDFMLVGVPVRGLAAIMPLQVSPDEAAAQMRAVLERAQADVAPAERISTVPFIMSSGEIVGFVSKKKGLLGRLFRN